MEIDASKEGRTLTDFNYACVGYSVFLDRGGNDPGIDKQAEKAELPVCVGLEVVLSVCTHHFGL
jgi:hypothetical protein